MVGSNRNECGARCPVLGARLVQRGARCSVGTARYSVLGQLHRQSGRARLFFSRRYS